MHQVGSAQHQEGTWQLERIPLDRKKITGKGCFPNVLVTEEITPFSFTPPRDKPS